MKDLLQKIFIGHVHKWKIIKSTKCRDSTFNETWDEYTLQCEHCGKMKTFDTL